MSDPTQEIFPILQLCWPDSRLCAAIFLQTRNKPKKRPFIQSETSRSRYAMRCAARNQGLLRKRKGTRQVLTATHPFVLEEGTLALRRWNVLLLISTRCDVGVRAPLIFLVRMVKSAAKQTISRPPLAMKFPQEFLSWPVHAVCHFGLVRFYSKKVGPR